MNIWRDEFFALRTEVCSIECNDKSTNNLTGTSKAYSKSIKFEGYKKCLDADEYQKESDNYFIRSLKHEMYVQKRSKKSLSIFDDKKCDESNIKSKPWEQNVYFWFVIRFYPLTFHFNTSNSTIQLTEMNTISKTNTSDSI